MVLVAVEQNVNARAWQELDIGDEVEIRVKGRGDLQLTGTVHNKPPGGRTNLPSRALGYTMGGSIRTRADDSEGLKAAEPLFFIRIRINNPHDVKLLIGQRVIVRASTEPKPLAVQWFRSLLQVLQKRSQV